MKKIIEYLKPKTKPAAIFTLTIITIIVVSYIFFPVYFTDLAIYLALLSPLLYCIGYLIELGEASINVLKES